MRNGDSSATRFTTVRPRRCFRVGEFGMLRSGITPQETGEMLRSCSQGAVEGSGIGLRRSERRGSEKAGNRVCSLVGSVGGRKESRSR